MNFLEEKIQKYHAKKLDDALQKMKFHENTKKQLESDLKMANNDESKTKIEEKINYQNEMIGIWKKSIHTINKQLKKLE